MTATATKRPTIPACIRRFCLDCMGANTGRGAYDCQSKICPLYPYAPFRVGRRRRASKRAVREYGRHCQPEDRTDCQGADCALYPWRPWQPGGQPRRGHRPTHGFARIPHQVGSLGQNTNAKAGGIE